MISALRPDMHGRLCLGEHASLAGTMPAVAPTGVDDVEAGLLPATVVAMTVAV